MADDIITRDSQGQLAVNTVSSTEANVPYNYDDCFTLDTNGRRALRVVGAGGGGSVDYTKVVSKTNTMPVASAANANMIYLYDGATNATYTHGHVYENKKTATYTGTVSFEPATLSGTTVACSGDNFANFLTESGVSPLSVVSGTITYDAAGSLWVLVGKNASDETVLSFQEYQEDYEDFGFTFTGTPVDGDVISFTCTVTEISANYYWDEVNISYSKPSVIPTLISTDWANNTQTITVNNVTADNVVIVSPAPSSAKEYGECGVLCTAQSANSLTFSCETVPTNNLYLNIVIM